MRHVLLEMLDVVFVMELDHLVDGSSMRLIDIHLLV
jgi:hypothetical protein